MKNFKYLNEIIIFILKKLLQIFYNFQFLKKIITFFLITLTFYNFQLLNYFRDIITNLPYKISIL